MAASAVATIPGAPTIGTATSTGTTTATVTYTAPSSDGGSTITSYTAVSSPGGITATVNTSSSGTINITGLSSGTSYTFVVYATNSVGNSTNSASSNSITTSTPITWWKATVSGRYTKGLSVQDTGEIFALSQNSTSYSTSTILTHRDQTGAISWSKTNTPATANFISGIAKERNISTGVTASTVYTVVTGDTSSTSYTDKAYLIKTDTSGAISWQKSTAISGQYFVNWQSAIGADHTGVGMINMSGIVQKFNTSGTTIFTKSVSGLTMAYGRALALREGYTYCVIDHWTGSGTIGGGVVLKINSSGSQVWQKSIMPPNATYLVFDTIEVDDNSDVYVAGRCSYLTNGSSFVKLTSAGAFSWGKTISSIQIKQVHYSKAQNAIYVIGADSSTPVIMKFDTSGTLLWQNTISGISDTSPVIDTKVNDSTYFFIASGGTVMKLLADGSGVGTGGVTTSNRTISSFTPTVANGPGTLGTGSVTIGTPSTSMSATTLTQTLTNY